MLNRSDPHQADIWLGLIWVQTVCKSYQQTTLVGKESIQTRKEVLDVDISFGKFSKSEIYQRNSEIYKTMALCDLRDAELKNLECFEGLEPSLLVYTKHG